MKKLVENQMNAEWISSKAKVVYRDDYGIEKFTANLRFKKDSLIWLNFKRLNVEGVRMQITPDSIYIINRLDNEYIVESLEKAQRKLGLPTNFQGMQAILLGNPVFFTKDFDADFDDSRYRLSGKTDRYETKYWLESEKYLLSQMEIDDYRNKRSLNVELKDYQETSGGENFSYFRHLDFSSRKYGAMSIEIDLSKVEFNVPKSIKFEIPDRYKKIDL
jgi:hypothetical protein